MSTTTGVNEIKTVNIVELKEMGRIFMERDEPMFVHGPPGVGKSDGFKQLADKCIPSEGLSNYELAEAEQVIASTWAFIEKFSKENDNDYHG